MTNFNRRRDDLLQPSQRELDRNHTELFVLLREIRDGQTDLAVKVGKVEAHVEGLSGPYGRVTALETTNTRQWWMHATITPLTAILYASLRKFGVHI